MAIDDEPDVTMRVINEEYERVLSNPDNVIMSDALQELMDLPMSDPEEPDTEASVDTLVITLIDNDGLGVSIRGRLSELSYNGSSTYAMSIETEKVRREFLSTLESYSKHSGEPEGLPLILGGLYETEVVNANVTEWALLQAGPHMFKVELQFRSDDVIF